MHTMTQEMLQGYRNHLINAEKSAATIEKYMRDTIAFFKWLEYRRIEKRVLMEYKERICSIYAPRSVNSMISSMNHFFHYLGWYDCKMKTLKIQKQIFSDKNKELTKPEYMRLLQAAKGNKRLFYLMQTICSTGIRVSELKYITVAAVKTGHAAIQCKGKLRTVILPQKLCRLLKGYIRGNKIKNGAVFVTKTGKPFDRSNIWADMKKLCKCAGVAQSKVFPHNLRRLFARTFYALQKDIVRLADILGHSNISTTRIYTMESGDVHRRQIEQMDLLCSFTT